MMISFLRSLPRTASPLFAPYSLSIRLNCSQRDPLNDGRKKFLRSSLDAFFSPLGEKQFKLIAKINYNS